MESKRAIHAEHFEQLPLESDTLSEDSRDVHTGYEPYSASGDDSLADSMHSRSSRRKPGSNLDDQRKTSSKLDVSAGAHQSAIDNSNVIEGQVKNMVDRTHQELQNKKSQPDSEANLAKQLPSKPGLYDTWVSKGLESLKRDHAQIKLEQSLRLTAAPQNFQLSSRLRPELDLSAPVKKSARKEPQPKKSVPDDSAPVPEPPSKKEISPILELSRSRISSPFPRLYTTLHTCPTNINTKLPVCMDVYVRSITRSLDVA